MSKELDTKVECFTIKKPKYQKLYIQSEDYIDTLIINGKEYKCSDIVKHEKAIEIIKEYILKDLVFNDKEQEINYSLGFYTICVIIKDKTKYEILKEVLL